jgi:hypothetical protein
MSEQRHSDLRPEHLPWLTASPTHPRHAKNLAYNIWRDITFGAAGYRYRLARLIAEAEAEKEANKEKQAMSNLYQSTIQQIGGPVDEASVKAATGLTLNEFKKIQGAIRIINMMANKSSLVAAWVTSPAFRKRGE